MESREDFYLKRLNDNSVATPTPVTQREMVLAELAGLKGLGIELPTVTSSDNGKVLTVTNGQWDVGEGGGTTTPTMFVTFTVTNQYSSDQVLTADKTFDEVFQAVNDGKTVVAKLLYMNGDEVIGSNLLNQVTYTGDGSTSPSVRFTATWCSGRTTVDCETVEYTTSGIYRQLVSMTGQSFIG